jgi:hypothetical protein
MVLLEKQEQDIMKYGICKTLFLCQPYLLQLYDDPAYDYTEMAGENVSNRCF